MTIPVGGAIVNTDGSVQLKDSASASANNVGTALPSSTLAPIHAPAQTRGVIFRGGVPYYPAPAGLVADGVMVISQAGQLYYRATNQVLPWEYGAVPGTSTTRVDSGPQLQQWLTGELASPAPQGAQPRGSKPNLPSGFWYTSVMLKLLQDDVTLDWRGALRPMTGYTGFLLKIGDGNRTGADLWGSYAEGAQWQNPVQIPRIVVDGMFEAQGIWMQNLDHFDVRIHGGRTRGAGLLVDRCREGKIHAILKHWLSAAPGEDITNPLVANLRVIDQGDGDATNSMDLNIRSVYGNGAMVAVESNSNYPSSGYPGPIRMIRLEGQFESPGSDYAYGATSGGSPRILSPYTGSKIYVGQTDAISFRGQFTPGALSSGSSMFTIGATGKLSTEFSLRGTVYGQSAPFNSYIVNLANATGWEVDLLRHQLGSVASPIKVAGINSNDPNLDYSGPRVHLADDYAMRLIGTTAAGRSASLEFQSPDGNIGRIFNFNGNTMALQPQKNGANLMYLDAQNRFYGDGAQNLQIGITGAGSRGSINKLLSAEPAEHPDGTMVWCDGVGWNPLNRAGGHGYPVVRVNATWYGLTLSTS